MRVFGINGKYFDDDLQFAYDGCHKIYILDVPGCKKEAIEHGYDIYPIDQIRDCYENSCPLKFIEKWSDLTTVIPQFTENDEIEWIGFSA